MRLREWTFVMEAIVRTYTGKGASELFDLLEKHKADVEKAITSVKGVESYTLVRSSDGDGGMSVTVGQDKTSIEESARTAKEWIAHNAGSIGAGAPKVFAGTVIIHATKR
jgi:hypothetical protein